MSSMGCGEMKNDMKKLVQQFAESVIGQDRAIMDGDSKLGNRYAEKYIACFRKLSPFGDEGKEALSTLFHHENPGVRSMAATFLLKFKTDEALSVLREVASGKGLIAFEASESIKRWEEGVWNLE